MAEALDLALAADFAEVDAAAFLAAGADVALAADFEGVGEGLGVAADFAETAEAALAGVATAGWPTATGSSAVEAPLGALALRKPPETRATAVRLPTVTFQPVECIASFLDLHTRIATGSEGEVELSAREFALLETFLRNPRRVFTREQLISRVWNFDFDPGSNVVDVYMGYLRRKLGAEHFTTVRGVGYSLTRLVGPG